MNKNREYKSEVFSFLVEQPEYALEIYNALNGTNYTDASEVKTVRLESGILLSRRNDAAFLLDTELNIYEHQSTYNPNMPLRSLFYYVDIIQEDVKGKDVFSRKRIAIPRPHFVVFYNGKEKRPDKEILRLSDLYEHKDGAVDLELICTVYNINEGQNKELLGKCNVLHGYSTFVQQVREFFSVSKNVDKAVIEAVDYCIQNKILSGFFRKHREEIVKMAILDMTWEVREPLIRKEEYEEGRKVGIEEGREVGIEEGIEELEAAIKAIKAGKTPEKLIAEGMNEKTVSRASKLV